MELRIQKKGELFELERKVDISELGRETDVWHITKSEFEALKKLSIGVIKRESYLLDESPSISIKIYHGSHQGLIRIEVEFETEEEARGFIPPGWFGPEITNSVLGKDSKLARLTQEEVTAELKKLKVQTKQDRRGREQQ